MDLDSLTRKFLYNLQEGKSNDVGIREYIQALGETLSSFRPRTQTEQRRLYRTPKHSGGVAAEDTESGPHQCPHVRTRAHMHEAARPRASTE